MLSSALESKEVSRGHGGGYWQVTENARVATWEKWGKLRFVHGLIEFLTMSHLGLGLSRIRGWVDHRSSSSETTGVRSVRGRWSRNCELARTKPTHRKMRDVWGTLSVSGTRLFRREGSQPWIASRDGANGWGQPN